jgi:hypothetical protein
MITSGTIIRHTGGTGTPLNGGNPIWILRNELQKAWSNVNKYDPVEGAYDCSEVRQIGIENPKLTINGYIDIDNTSGTFTICGYTGSVKMTEYWLIQLACLKYTTNSYLVLEDWSGTTGNKMLGRATDSGYPATTQGIVVSVDTFDFQNDASSERGHIWNYSLKLTEIKRPT